MLTEEVVWNNAWLVLTFTYFLFETRLLIVMVVTSKVYALVNTGVLLQSSQYCNHYPAGAVSF